MGKFRVISSGSVEALGFRTTSRDTTRGIRGRPQGRGASSGALTEMVEFMVSC